MIVVVADDFTGAAEVAGLAFNKGLKVLMGSDVNAELKPNVDVFVLVADTRSMQKAAAVNYINKLTKEIIALKPDRIYKKVDSVLRGYVYDELWEQKECEGKRKVIVLAGNPHFNRVIVDGIFYVNGQKIADTSFANDIEFPATSSNVVEMLHETKCTFCKLTDELPEEGFVVGSVDSMETLCEWVKRLDDSWVIAGGAAFFECILDDVFPTAGTLVNADSDYVRAGKSIVFFGSNYPKNSNFASDLVKKGLQYVNLEEDFFLQTDECKIQQKAKEIVALAERHETMAISSMFNITDHSKLTPCHIRNITGKLAAEIFKYQQFDELFIEGGATAYAIIQNLGIKLFEPVRGLAPGIIQMKDTKTNLSIITKPGSYSWPAYIIPHN